MESILNMIPAELGQQILALIGAVAGFYLTLLLRQIKIKTGVDIELSRENEVELLRGRLTEVICNSVRIVKSNYPSSSVATLIDLATDYVLGAIPETMEKLKADPTVIRKRVSSALDTLIKEERRPS